MNPRKRKQLRLKKILEQKELDKTLEPSYNLAVAAEERDLNTIEDTVSTERVEVKEELKEEKRDKRKKK